MSTTAGQMGPQPRQLPTATPSPFRKVAENSAWMLGSEVGARAISFLTVLYLSRTLSAAGMGLVEYGMAIFHLVSFVTLGGVDMVMTRQAARNRIGLGRMAGVSVLVTWLYFAASYGLLAAGTWLLPLPAELERSILVFGLAAAVLPLGARFAFVASERFATVAVTPIVGQLAFLGSCYLLVRGPGDALLVGALWLLATTTRTALQLASFVRSFGWIRLRAPLSRVIVVLRSTLALGVANLARSTAVFVDVLLLGLLVSSSDVANYSLAQKIPLFLVTLVSYVHSVTVPTLARMIPSANRAHLGAIETDLVKAGLGAALPGFVCLALVADPLMEMLFTDKFSGAATLFPVLLLRFPIAAAGGLVRNIVWIARPVAAARVATQVLLAAVVAVTTLAFAFGAKGGACGIVIAEAFAVALYAFHARPWLTGLRLADRVWIGRLAACATLLAGFAWLQPHLQPLAAIACAGLVWSVSTLVLNLPYLRRLLAEIGGVTGVRQAG